MTAYFAAAFLAFAWLALTILDAPKTDGFERSTAKFFVAGFLAAGVAVIVAGVFLQRLLRRRDPNSRGNVIAALFLGALVPLFGFPKAGWLLLSLGLAVTAGFTAVQLSLRSARTWYSSPAPRR